MCRILIAAAAMAATATAVSAGGNYVQGYNRKDGTYVQPHYRSNPDGNRLNNYSTEGNYNPYTGRQGTVDPYATNNSYGVYGNSNNLRKRW